ncbi:MAG: hypothetical protein Kow0042_08550 [Calditrichia bacterium]
MSIIKQWFDAQNIDLNLTAQSELDTIVEMMSLVEKDSAAADLKELARDLLHHEVVSPSAKGSCAVVFRVCSDAAKALRIYFGRFDGGIGYFSRSGHPIDLIFLVIAPPEEKVSFVAAVEKLENLLSNKNVREQLRNAKQKETIVRILKKNLVSENKK